jgi:uridine kinase
MREMKRLLAAIDAAAPRAGSTRVIAIDGRAGAGKSTLAEALASRIGAPIVALEDLYGGWDGLDRGVALLSGSVLVPLTQGRAASVPRYDWAARAWGEPWALEPPGVLIVEGVGAGAEALAPYTSVLVWLECDDAVRRERWLDRRPSDAGEWVRWGANEQSYIERERPRAPADLVLGAS